MCIGQIKTGSPSKDGCNLYAHVHTFERERKREGRVAERGGEEEREGRKCIMHVYLCALICHVKCTYLEIYFQLKIWSHL